MAISFNAKMARDMTDTAIINIEKEERRKIEEVIEKIIIPEIKTAANKGLGVCAITIASEVNFGKLEKTLTEEMGFNVARKNAEYTIRW